MAKALVPIIQIADDACEFVGDTTLKYRGFMAKKCALAYKEIRMFVDNSFSVHTSEHRIRNVIEMPKDCVYVTKVAMRYCGKVVYLGRNYSLDVVDEYDPHHLNQTEVHDYFKCPDEGYEIPMYGHNGEIIMACGKGVKSDGLYRIDEQNGLIYPGSNIPMDATLLIEYVTDGISEGVKFVPTETYTVLLNYALWHYYLKKGDRRYREFERYHSEEYYRLKNLYQDLPIKYITSLFSKYDYGTINDHI